MDDARRKIWQAKFDHLTELWSDLFKMQHVANGMEKRDLGCYSQHTSIGLQLVSIP